MYGGVKMLKIFKIIFFCVLSIISATVSCYYLLLDNTIGILALIAYLAFAIIAIEIISGEGR